MIASWRPDLAFVSGLTLPSWLRLLAREQFAVDLPYVPRALAISALTVMNSALAAARPTIDARGPPPIFVLGHFRHGTTFLHELLAADPQLTFPSTWEVMAPWHFARTERWAVPLVDRVLPETRPQDAMPIRAGSPQEDEYAIALTSLCSPYFAFVFPRSERRWLAYLRLTDVPPAEVDRWKDAVQGVVARHAVRDRRPLVLKSPAHTARVRLLLELFPDARFVHVHRDPYEVFRSTCHLVRAAAPHLTLQRLDFDTLEERVLRWYTELYDGWFADQPLLRPDQWTEVGFSRLSADPLGTMREIYAHWDLPFPQTAIERHLTTVRDHPRNRYLPLSEAERARVASAWARSFDAWGYPR